MQGTVRSIIIPRGRSVCRCDRQSLASLAAAELIGQKLGIRLILFNTTVDCKIIEHQKGWNSHDFDDKPMLAGAAAVQGVARSANAPPPPLLVLFISYIHIKALYNIIFIYLSTNIYNR